jgi:hypothetical protein
MFAPFGSSEEDRSAQWHPEPQFRGTFQILSSCLVTIGLCVWTAVHLNVPEHDHKKKLWPSRQFWRKTGWLILGVFAPELVSRIAEVDEAPNSNQIFRWPGPRTSSTERLAESMH